MSKGLITQVDRIDDLIYEFYEKLDSAFLKEKPELRFLLLSPMLNELCIFNLANNKESFNNLLGKIKVNPNEYLKISSEICSSIQSIIGEPTYFAASYWSPIDRKRHTISHSKEKFSILAENEARASALLFYILTYKAPPRFHSAINYISTVTPRKDGLHSFYGEDDPFLNISCEERYQIWWHFPESIHESLLNYSGFSAAIEELKLIDSNSIERSLTILMENIDNESVENEIKKYEKIYLPIIEKAKSFEIPETLGEWAAKFDNFLNNFFYPFDVNNPEQKKLTLIQSFFMACTHALYNKACPTKMFYTFPVRVADTCCVLTLGVENKLKLETILAMSLIVKSLYYHGLDRDYQALNALERNRIAHGAVHKIRGPLNILKEFPYDLEEMLKSGLTEEEFQKVSQNLLLIKKSLKSSIENILIGVKSLENFIDIENPIRFNLIDVINRAKRTYEVMEVRVLEKLEIENLTKESVIVFGVTSHIQFIFEELISNSIRAFKYHYSNTDKTKLSILIKISQNSTCSDWIVNFIDNGIGIPHDKKNKIFLSGNRGNDSGGSGKGLFLSKIFMSKYGNNIIECGEYGKGANFELTFKKINNNEIKNPNC